MTTAQPTNLQPEYPTAPAKPLTSAESEFPPAPVTAPVPVQPPAKLPTSAESEFPPAPVTAPIPTKEPACAESGFPPAPAPAKVEAPVGVAPEKLMNTPILPVTSAGDRKTSVAVAGGTPKNSNKTLDRDVALTEVKKEKKLSFVKAWEESEKAKVENRTQKELSAINSWENTKKADVEAKLKQFEEKIEKKKAEYAEMMKNKAALIHKQAEEKRAIIEAKRREELLKAEESAAKYRAIGKLPKKTLGCFGG